jgi:hypothetical protein
MKGTPCLFVEEKQHERSNTREETMGQKEEGETAGHRSRNDRICGWCGCHDRAKDGVHPPCQWQMGNVSDAFARVPHLTPLCRMPLHIDFRAITCLRSHSPPSRFWQSQKGRRAEIMPCGIPGAEGLNAHAR